MIVAEGQSRLSWSQGPLLRASWCKLAAENHVLLVTGHHLVCDGWTVNVIVDELGELYSAAVQKTRRQACRR